MIKKNQKSSVKKFNEKIKSKGKAKEEKVKKAIKAIGYKSLADINQLVERYNNDELNRKA